MGLEPYELANGFLTLALSLSVMTVILALTVSKDDQWFTLIVSGSAGFCYLMVTWTGVLDTTQFLVLSVLAMIHFGADLVAAVLLGQAVEQIVQEASLPKTQEMVSIPLEIYLSKRPPNSGNDDYQMTFRVWNGSFRGGCMFFRPLPDGDWWYRGNLTLFPGEKRLELMVGEQSHWYDVDLQSNQLAISLV